ncbi:hypothetical protein RMCBS344292_16882 [Rhizopus microsporus]|nr:hypothetical protein RMCBS344292_16882 [Rhizopus microsporus]
MNFRRKSTKRNSILPHLPKAETMPNAQISEPPMMPGQKTLPSDDWKNDGHGQQLVRTGKQGVPWTDRQSKVQLDSDLEPPPVFTATPSRGLTLRQPTKSQRHVFRMESGIDPVVLLTTRLETWRTALKNLVPFRHSSGQFLESGGIQDVWAALRDYTIQHGMLHHETSTYLTRAVIPALRGIKADIKTMVYGIQKDKDLKSVQIYKSRVEVDRLIRELDRTIEQVQMAPHQAERYTDPFLVNLCVIHAIRGLCDYENELHDNILNLQKETGVFEYKIIENVRYILQKYQEYRLKHKMEHKDFIGHVNDLFNRVKPNTEWDEFVRRHQYHLVMENAAYKTESSVEYPQQDSKYVRAVKIGPLRLRSGISRSWAEGVYILTPAGFLHGYKTPKHFQTNPLHPSYTLFIPNTSVENSEDDDLCFEIYEERRRLGGGHYVFRASKPREAQEWFDALVRISNQHRITPLLEYDQQPGFSTTSRQRDLPPLPPSTWPEPPKQAIEGPPQQNTLDTVHEENGQDEPVLGKQEPQPESSTADPRLEGEDDHSFILA